MSIPIEKPRLRRKWMVLAAAASLAIAKFDRPANADVTASWISTGLGYWTTAADWSTSPQYPQNGKPSGTNYQVNISATTGIADVEVLSVPAITVDSITVGQNAVLIQEGGTLTTGELNLSSGGFLLSAGVLSGGASGGLVTLSSPSQFELQSGTLDNLTFSGSNLVSSSFGTIKVTNGLNLSGNTLTLGNNAAHFTFYNSQTIDDLSIEGTGSSPASLSLNGSNGQEVLTLGPNAIIHGSVSLSSQTGGDSLLNYGMLNADIGAQTLAVENSNFTNSATAEATNGGTLYLYASAWSNATSGTISAGRRHIDFRRKLEQRRNDNDHRRLNGQSGRRLYADKSWQLYAVFEHDNEHHGRIDKHG